MKKLKIKRSVKEKEPDIHDNYDRLPNRLLCQFEIPGVGRLRTGEKHSDFHITDLKKTDQLRYLSKEK